jgi:predicted dehydrogenase
MKYQMRNWYNFTWLSGDIPGLTLVHSLDKGSWALGDVPPQRAWGMGGRQVRTDREFGDVFDHQSFVYEYANGARMYAYVRQQNGCFDSVDDQIVGTKGLCDLQRGRITGETNWQYRGPRPAMHDQEHVALFGAIRAGKPINNGNYMVISTMLAVMGRLASYTGQAITWEQVMNSKLSLAPAAYTWDAAPPAVPDAAGNYPIAKPGIGPVTI